MHMCIWLSSVFCAPVPIPTYLLGPTEKQEMKHYTSVSLENGGELCENVTYLGKPDCMIGSNSIALRSAGLMGKGGFGGQ